MVNTNIELYVSDLDQYVKNSSQVVYCDNSAFDEASSTVLEKSDYLINSIELADLQIKDVFVKNGWRNSSICSGFAHYSAEESLFNPKSSTHKRIILRPSSIDQSLILKNATAVVKAHNSGKEFYLNNFDLDTHLKMLGAENFYIFDKNDLREDGIPVGSFNDFGIMHFRLGNNLTKYEDLCKHAGFKEINVWTYCDSDIDKHSEPFVTQVSIRSFDYHSAIDCYSKIIPALKEDFRLLGVRR
jgi:hypothetical protein